MPVEELSLNPKQLKSITDRLDALIRLTALSLPDTVSEDSKVEALFQSGLTATEIGPMLGMTPLAVRLRLFRMRKKRKESSKPETSEEKQLLEKDTNGEEETDHTGRA